MTLERANKILEGTGIRVVANVDYEGFYPRRMYHFEDRQSSSNDYRTVKETTGEAVKYYLTKKRYDYAKFQT